MPSWAPTKCECCCAPVVQRPRGRPRRWCSDACKVAAWRALRKSTAGSRTGAHGRSIGTDRVDLGRGRGSVRGR